LTETETRPAFIIGTSSDRIGTPSGQSFYGTLSKSLHRETGLPVAPYLWVTYGTYEHRWRPISGLNVNFTKRLSSAIIFDGVHVHPLLNFTTGRNAFSLIMVRGKEPGVSYSVSF
jgi:hypothetical protein